MTKIRIVLIGLIAFGALVPTRVARAQDDSINRAREYFDRASDAYQQGKYAEAIEQFDNAYDIRKFPQFLFNIGASYEKLAQEDPSTLEHWDNAIKYYDRYLTEAPKADDRKDVKKRITRLKKERKRIAKLREELEKEADDGEAKADEKEITTNIGAELSEARIRGLVVIESEPAQAYIYLDSKKKGPVGRTPWSGSIEGEHRIFIERKGYKPHETRISPSPDKLLVVQVGLAEQDYLGWLDIKSNVPGASIYIDDKDAGVYSKTPYSGNFKPGKHKVWITAEGYDEYYKEIEVVAGQTHDINAKLSGSPVGYLNIRGHEIENTRIYLDGEVLCERGPCRKAVKEGKHRVTVKRAGYKSYSRTIDMQPRTEVLMRANLAKKPGRGDAIVAILIGAAFAGGGVYLGLEAQDIETELRNEIETSDIPPDNNDPRYLRGKLFAAGADVAYGLAGISLLTAIYYTFRDKGAPSKGTSEVRALALEPQLTPGFAGVRLGVSW